MNCIITNVHFALSPKSPSTPTWQKYILQYWLKNKYFKTMQTSATPALWLHAYGLFTIWKIHYFVLLSFFLSSPWNVFAPSSTSTFRHPDRANTLQTWPGRLKLLKTCHTNGKTKSKSKTERFTSKNKRDHQGGGTIQADRMYLEEEDPCFLMTPLCS